MIVLGRVITLKELYEKKYNQEHAPTSRVHSFTKCRKKFVILTKKKHCHYCSPELTLRKTLNIENQRAAWT